MTELILKDWFFKQAEHQDWTPARKGLAATEIHPDLHNAGVIPDPFVDDNEINLQWIGEKDWEYKTTFSVQEKNVKVHDLIFEGLDTFADVYLNGKKILSTENMFTQYKANVNEQINLSGDNELRIYFHSALLKGRELEKIHGKLGAFNGEPTRLQIRKAQYHYGWDWGPLFMTCGPYRPVKLVSYDAYIDDVYVKVDVSKELTADIDIETKVLATTDADIQVHVIAPNGDPVKSFSESTGGSETVSSKLNIAKPDLWFPFTHGNPSLYKVVVSITPKGSDKPVQTITKKVGLRRAEVVQEPVEGEPGTSFYFKINNVPVYCSGSDWIPAHSFQTSLTNQDYTDWMEIMADGNQNMIRIWGGGYYEQDILYEECDRLGIMIWHDLMFACGQYPGYKEYLDLVSEEIDSQLKRLRNYYSIVLIVGNNEDYQAAESYKLQWDKEDTSGDYSKTNFPARTLYENIFPKMVSEMTSNMPYHPGSPWGGSWSSDPTVGDIHQWNVWHGEQEKYQNWYKLGGRFVSEFGMEALPNRKTYEDCITDKNALYPQSYLVDHHNKSDGFERRLALYVIENLQVDGLDLDSWIYATQLMQAECLGYAYRCWRRDWNREGKRSSGGALVWQINDCWPCASWAIVDYYKRPKLGYYSVKRESKTLGVGIYRNEIKEEDEYKKSNFEYDYSPPFNYSPTFYKADIWGVNSGTEDVPAILKIEMYNVTTGELISNIPDEEVVLKANQTTEFVKDLEISNKLPVVIYGKVVSKKDGSVIASAGDWPQPLKYLLFPNREVKVNVKDGLVELTANKPVKGVEITLDKDLYIDDNGFDIFPNEVKTVHVKDLKASDNVQVKYYQQSKSK